MRLSQQQNDSVLVLRATGGLELRTDPARPLLDGAGQPVAGGPEDEDGQDRQSIRATSNNGKIVSHSFSANHSTAKQAAKTTSRRPV